MPTVITSEQEQPPEAISSKKRGALLQYPRRVLFLFISFGIALFLVRSFSPNERYFQGEVSQAAPRTLMLLVAAWLLAVLVALGLAAIGALAHFLQEKVGWVGTLVKAVGRLSLFSTITAPIPVLALFSLLLSLLVFDSPPVAGGSNSGAPIFLIVTIGLVLALFVALVAAQNAVHMLTLPYRQRSWRHLFAALSNLLGAVFLQTGGLLSALTVAEAIFNWPGVGRLLVAGIGQRDLSIITSILLFFAIVVLAGRLLGELLQWVATLLLAGSQPLVQSGAPGGRRRWWTIFALLLLLIPLALFVVGSGIPAEATMRQDFENRLTPPSPEHPLGTDALGRDLWSRTVAGAHNTILQAFLSAGLTLFPTILLSMIAAALAASKGWLLPSLADLLFLPTDVLLFFPLVPGVLAILALVGNAEPTTSLTVVALLLLGRTVRAGRALWLERSEQATTLRYGLVALAGLLLGTLFMAFTVQVSLEALGFGPLPPTPSLGHLLQGLQQHLIVMPRMLAIAMLFVALCTFAFYTAADAMIGFSYSKKPMAHLNE